MVTLIILLALLCLSSILLPCLTFLLLVYKGDKELKKEKRFKNFVYY